MLKFLTSISVHADMSKIGQNNEHMQRKLEKQRNKRTDGKVKQVRTSDVINVVLRCSCTYLIQNIKNAYFSLKFLQRFA